MRNDIVERKEEILKWIEDNESHAEIARRLECKVDTLKSYFKKWGIEYKGNKGLKGKKTDPKRKSAEELAQTVSITSYKLKNRILEDNIKEKKCEICGLEEWLGKTIPLELHHIDGNHSNNDLSNLQVICPNCHAFTDNYRAKNRKK